jgi:D-glycero-alpha-D-manno-heptose 1-phosphate guanylyltransferase
LKKGNITEAIILAGGLGTRLQSIVPELPKSMAPVNGRPFIAFVIEHFLHCGVKKFIFALGYKHEPITIYLRQEFAALNYLLSVEKEPLGTGGAIKLACNLSTENNVLVANGDTLFKVDIAKLGAVHKQFDADCTLALKPMGRFDRYGAVILTKDHLIENFKEKKYYREGFINGGVYLLNKNRFLQEALSEKFSFEKDYLEKFAGKRRICGVVQDEYFIDIGVPDDFQRAQIELKA